MTDQLGAIAVPNVRHLNNPKAIRSPRYYDDIVKQYIIDNWDRIVWRETDFVGIPVKIMKQELQQIPRNRFKEIVCRKYCETCTFPYNAEQCLRAFGVPLPKRCKGCRYVPAVQLRRWYNDVFRQKYCPNATHYPAYSQGECDENSV
jgi:hypothetical protein